MKKIISITIIAFILLLFTALSTLAGNPPGLIVRDDGQSEDTPWEQTETYFPQEDDSNHQSISPELFEVNLYDRVLMTINIIIDIKLLTTENVEFESGYYEENTR